MKPDFCKSLVWRETLEGGQLVTPFRFDDGDNVVIFAHCLSQGWRLDDNGEALFRLSTSGVDPESERVQARIADLQSLLGVQCDEAEKRFIHWPTTHLFPSEPLPLPKLLHSSSRCPVCGNRHASLPVFVSV